MSVLRRCVQTAVGLSVGGLALGTLVAPGVASAAPAGVGANVSAAEACAPGQGVLSSRSDGYVRDPGPSQAEVRAYEDQFDAAFDALSPAERSSAAGEGKTVTIPVHVHAIQTSKNTVKAPRKRIKQQIRIMNRAYKGNQSKASAKTKFRFRLKSVDRTVNKRWYTAALGDRAANKMKRKLHKGGSRALNLYLSAPEINGGTLFGWATFPADLKRQPKIDGVVINYGSMMNGKYTGYNKGDTAVHEAGHWLGLYHTFQGGCSKLNDRVKDTPREATPNYECPKSRNTCKAPGKDPIHNFMDYSYDKCMTQFTFGQSKRMNRQWAAFRAR
ncbi:zinc metalloprotease [Solicola gregarius]|uniref:Zinc metalloprotease n=1 Tax=Solicola gregarius TaxID=2908642 RepID=A0AA46YK02_9ACTN|nr:zinc metalloprotease [Solicola gregarius]UYM04109.1 zinc metalloprotease [Solicola gregarius]